MIFCYYITDQWTVKEKEIVMKYEVLLLSEYDKDLKKLLLRGKSRRRKNKVKLKNLVMKITPDNIHKEIDWGKPVGKEIW